MFNQLMTRIGPRWLGFIISMGVLLTLMLFAVAIVANDLVLIGTIHHFESVINAGNAQRLSEEAKQATSTCKSFQELNNSIKGAVNINANPDGLGNKISIGIRNMYSTSGCPQLLRKNG
jgi:hypothetical protein